MAVIAQIIPAEYWLALVPAAVAIAWLTCAMSTQAKSTQAPAHQDCRPRGTPVEAAHRADIRDQDARRSASDHQHDD